MNEMWKSVMPASHASRAKSSCEYIKPFDGILMDRQPRSRHQRTSGRRLRRMVGSPPPKATLVAPRRRASASAAMTGSVAMFSFRISSVIEQ